jgi:hypothetical protein
MAKTPEKVKQVEEEGGAILKKQPDTKPIINPNAVAMYESMTINYGTVNITISDKEGGLLEGLTSEEAILLCSDILRQFSGEGSLEEQIDVPIALRETLQVNYGWSDLEFNTFVKTWRRNLYLLRIGQQNKSDLNLKEFKTVLEFMEKKKIEKDSLGDSSLTAEQQMEIE